MVVVRALSVAFCCDFILTSNIGHGNYKHYNAFKHSVDPAIHVFELHLGASIGQFGDAEESVCPMLLLWSRK